MSRSKKAGTKRPKTASRRRAPRAARRNATPMGAVSTMSTAPVAIGNSLRGSKPCVVKATLDSCRVIGRDYAFTATNTGSCTGWCYAGGFPLNPAAFTSSVIRNYVRMYNKFKFNAVRVHYITSSSTATNGDVLIQVTANRDDPAPVWSSTSFLPYALSKPETVIGPQWTNHTVSIVPKGPTKVMVTGSNLDLNAQAQGEIALYSKTSSTESPGYFLIDYDITFSEMSVNPRSSVLPHPLIMYFPFQLKWSTAALTSGSTVPSLTFGTDFIGGTAITDLSSLTGYASGDVFKVYIDWTNTIKVTFTVSAGSVPSANQLFSQPIESTTGNTAMALNDGFDLYMVATGSAGSATAAIHSNPAIAFSGNSALRCTAGVNTTPNAYASANNVPSAGVWLFGYASWVGSVNSNTLQQQI